MATRVRKAARLTKSIAYVIKRACHDIPNKSGAVFGSLKIMCGAGHCVSSPILHNV